MAKFIFILFASAIVSFHPACRAPTKHYYHIMDYEHDLDTKQLRKLDSLYEDHEENTTNEIALVTTSSFCPDSNIDLYALHKFRALGLGRPDISNGLIIVFSKANHSVRITTGLGTEKVLTNDVAKRIIDSVMLPPFREDSIYKGLWMGSYTIVDFLERQGNRIR